MCGMKVRITIKLLLVSFKKRHNKKTKMKKNFIQTALCGAWLLATALFVGACSNDDDSSSLPSPVTLTVTVTPGATRTTFSEADDTYSTWKWSTGDVLYVADATGVIGSLSLVSGAGENSGTFSGTLTLAQGTTYRFWYLGSNPGTVSGTSYTLNLASQAGTLAAVGSQDVMTGTSQVTVNGSNATISSLTLTKQLCVLHLEPTIPTTVLSSYTATGFHVSGTNVYSSVSFDLASGTASPVEGTIATTSSFSDDVYLSLYPANGVVPTFIIATQSNGNYSGTPSSSWNLTAGYFYRGNASTSGTKIAISCKTKASPVGALSGLFSVSATQQVYMAQGNLQYIASSNTWKFADNQYDYIGNAAGNTTAEASRSSQSSAIDLFGWGTSGYNSKYPYMVSTTAGDYAQTGNVNIAGTNYDWGVNCAISNGGGVANEWRTLTGDEWTYLITGRNTTTAYKAYKCQLTTGGVTYNGLMVLPDDNTADVKTSNYPWTAWASCPQFTAIPSGALFLPAAGQRNSSSDGTAVADAGDAGLYWSSTSASYSDAKSLWFGSSAFQTSETNPRNCGFSVRLAQNK